MKTIEILGIPVVSLTKSELLSLITQTIDSAKKLQIVTLYSSMPVWARSDVKFKEILKGGTLNIADGIGVLAAAEFLYARNLGGICHDSPMQVFVDGIKTAFQIILHRHFTVIPDESSGVDLIEDLINLSSQNDWRVFLLGGTNGVAEELKKRFNNDDLIASFDGPFDIEKATKEELRQLIDCINNFKPHLTFVAFGPVRQEKWIAQNLDKLNTNVIVGVGGAFNLLTGKVKRAPQVVQKVGLEWLWRVLVDPRNLPKAFLAFPVFPLLVAKERLRMIKSK